jgi:hypothetical protein
MFRLAAEALQCFPEVGDFPLLKSGLFLVYADDLLS